MLTDKDISPSLTRREPFGVTLRRAFAVCSLGAQQRPKEGHSAIVHTEQRHHNSSTTNGPLHRSGFPLPSINNHLKSTTNAFSQQHQSLNVPMCTLRPTTAIAIRRSGVRLRASSAQHNATNDVHHHHQRWSQPSNDIYANAVGRISTSTISSATTPSSSSSCSAPICDAHTGPRIVGFARNYCPTSSAKSFVAHQLPTAAQSLTDAE